jgi:hypothetical protein
MLAPAATKGAWPKFRRVARRVGWISAALVLGLVAVGIASVLWLESAAGRRWLCAKVNDFVSHELVADLRIERLEVLSSHRIVASQATLLDEHGRALLRVNGLEARFELVSLVEHILFGPAVRVTVPEVSAERLEVGLYRDARGDLELTHAFESSTPSPSRPGARPVRVELPHIAVRAVSVKNDLPGVAQAKAELTDLGASFEVGPGLFALGLDSQHLRVADALPVELRSSLQARIRLPGTTDASLAGSLGTLPVSASFQAHGAEVSMRASTASAAPESVQKLIPGWPLLAPISAKAELSGRWGALTGRAEASSGPSSVVASGPVELDPPSGKLDFTARALDVRLLAPAAPSTALDADGALEFKLRPSVRVELTAQVREGELAGHRLPKTSVHAVYAADGLAGTIALLDRALPLDASFTLSQAGKLEFHARAQELGLEALAPYGIDARGYANAEAAGVLARGELDARFDAKARALRVGVAELGNLSLEGTLRGSTARPRDLGVNVRAQGRDFAVENVHLPMLELEADGSLAAARLELRGGAAQRPSWSLAANVALASGVTLSEARAETELGDVALRLEVAEARINPPQIEVRGAHLTLGDGEITADGAFGPKEKHAELAVSNFEPSALAQYFGLEHDALGGRFDARLSFAEDAHGRRGSLHATVENGAFGAVAPVFGDVTAALDGSVLDADGSLGAASLGRTKFHGHASLGHHPVSAETLSTATGELKFDVSEVDLSALERRLAGRSVASLTGHADGNVWLARNEPEKPLEAGYELEVHELTLGGQGSGQPLLHVDVSTRGTLDPKTARFDVEVKDDAGIWLKTRTELAFGTSRELELIEAGRTDAILATPLRAELVALPRPLERFGGVTRSLPNGNLSGNVSVMGTLGRPELDGKLTVSQLAIQGLDARSEIAALFAYSAEREEYSATVQATGSGVRKLDFTGGGHCGWITHGFGSDFSLDSKGRADRIALSPLGDLLGVKLGGELSGQGSLTASARSLEAAGDFSVKGLTLERRALGTGSGAFSVHQGLAKGRLEIAHEGSKLMLSSELGLDWAAGTPRVDPRRGGNVQAEVRNYELSMLAPLLRAFVSEVSGPINGFVALDWGPEEQTGKRKTELRANASVSGGRLRFTRGTGSIQNVELRALAGGDGALHLTLAGSASSKEPDVFAKADVLWDGPLPRRVEAELRAKRFPVSYEGVLLGTATIEKKARPIRAVIDLSGAEQRVDVSVPALEFELPTKEDTRLIELAPDPAVRVTDASMPPEAAAAANGASSLVLTVTLGDAVRLKQPDLLVPVTGKLTRSEDGWLDGALILPEGGTVSAFGQVFRLKQSSVRFAKQPVELGVLAIQASARTVEGIVVDLDVSGTVKKPVVRFRSDPPRSEGEIISLLLGIRPDDSSAVPGQQDVGGSAMALAMNQLLRDSPLAGFQFGETQSRTGDTISTVSFRAGNKVWLEGWSTRQNQGTPYEATRSSGVVDWRFAPGYSLRTQLGYPSGVEVRWSHRY